MLIDLESEKFNNVISDSDFKAYLDKCIFFHCMFTDDHVKLLAAIQLGGDYESVCSSPLKPKPIHWALTSGFKDYKCARVLLPIIDSGALNDSGHSVLEFAKYNCDPDTYDWVQSVLNNENKELQTVHAPEINI